MKKLHVDGSLDSLVFEKVWDMRIVSIGVYAWRNSMQMDRLDSLDFESLETWKSYHMGKMTESLVFSKMELESNLLEVIHFDVCSPMSAEACSGYRYVLTLTDDLSRYEYVYLMKHKFETFEKFKEFQSEVENHRNKKIKFLRSDRGGEYLSYEFGLHLKQWEIVSQLTPPRTPQRNGVSERRNRTLLDMVRSKMSLTDLPLSFWGVCIRDNCIHVK